MIQFIPEGPKIPEELEYALRNDNLVFFCGAGISANNGLPLFAGLVEKVCDEFSIDKDDPLLKEAFAMRDYDGILDILEGDESCLVRPKKLRKKIIDILSSFKGKPNIHKALLDLSSLSDKEGYRLVTTNFDRLFFEAGLDSNNIDKAPKLGPPRKGKWRNPVFLHGVIDQNYDFDGSDLILTKTDFGLAYVYDSWASRFIMQLFQENFKVLFIGFSGDDPIMNYLFSAISAENKRRKKEFRDAADKSFAYAFVECKKGEEIKSKNKWKARGITPIPYELKNKEDHSLLYETITQWAEQKNTGLSGRKIWLRQRLQYPYNSTDKKMANTVISFLRTDKRLADYFLKIDLSTKQINTQSKCEKAKPVDISWLKPLSEQGLLNTLISKTAKTTSSQQWNDIWGQLSYIEEKVIQWLVIHHLDKKELIHWIIDKGCNLHPYLKCQIRMQIQDNRNNLDKHILQFWTIIASNTYNQVNDSFHSSVLTITQINLNRQYCPVTMQSFLEQLEPTVEFDKYSLFKDKIYRPNLAININHHHIKHLENKEVLLKHAEDFTQLLQRAMELAELFEIIKNKDDIFYIHRPSIAEHSQNKSYYPSWTYLVDLTRDSFELTIVKNKVLSQLLLKQWMTYPYSIFHRLVLYVITKYPELDKDEAIAIDLLKRSEILWSITCQNEVCKYLRNREHSKEAVKKLLPLIKAGPPKISSVDNTTSDEQQIIELQDREVYHRLNCLKDSKVYFPKDVELYYNNIQSRYSLLPYEEKDDFPFFHGEIRSCDDREIYLNLTPEEIYNDIKNTKSHHSYECREKKEGFRNLTNKLPDKAFKVIQIISKTDIKAAPIYGVFMNTIVEISDSEKSNKYFLEALQKLDSFKDSFIKDCLWSVVYSLKIKAGFIYTNDKSNFEKWWNRLWKLSIGKTSKRNNKKMSNFYFDALNSKLGKLSETILDILWNYFFPKHIPKNKKIPKELKQYFHTIIKTGCEKDPAILSHFGNDLWHLWHLDRDWVIKYIKPAMHWNKENQNLCKSIWEGYSYHMIVSPDFMIDFKNEVLDIILNSESFYKTNSSNQKINNDLCMTIAEILYIATGGKGMTNIFNEAETKKIVRALNTELLEHLSSKIWQVLRDSDNPANLWKKKIKDWIKRCWPSQTSISNSQIEFNLCLIILHCSNELPDAFKDLSNQIDISSQSQYPCGIIEHIKWNKEQLENIFKYPRELLWILNWDLSSTATINMLGHKDELQYILDKLKNQNPNIEKDYKLYKQIKEKIS